MNEEPIAHRREDDGEVQLLRDHLLSVGKLSGENASKLSLTDATAGEDSLRMAGELLGLLHDLGKYSKDFQDYLKSATGLIDQDADDYVDSDRMRGKIDHSTAGAQHIWNRAKDATPAERLAAQILALCIASHHSGLIDCIGPEGDDAFTRRLSKADGASHYTEAKVKLAPDISQRVEQLITDGKTAQSVLQAVTAIARLEGGNRRVCEFKIGLLARFLFSCLIDADRTDTADFEKPRSGALRQRGLFVGWGELAARLEKHLDALPADNFVNRIRRDVANQCLNAAGRERAIFSLTVPTGGGKTLASLRFALNHAAKHRLDRIIYVIPYTSIIDQNADVARSILEPRIPADQTGAIVLEHHSNLMPEEQTWRAKILSENWDAPVVFTTSVQFLETLFGAGTRGARRMHQLARSVVVFDEVQTLPVNCVHLFNNAINFLVEHCGSSVVLCTATQPLLNGVAADKGAARFTQSDEIIPDPAALFTALKRTDIQPELTPGGWTDEQVAGLIGEEIQKAGSCLAIVNTRKSARSLYETADVPPEGKKFHLSTMMCPAHRRAKLAEIRERLASGLPTVCVSTQLIEAGVDVDFGSVIRYVAGLDSIAQAAGRCNRNGLRVVGRVHVVNPAQENIELLKDIRKGREVAERILQEYEENPSAFQSDLLSPAAIEMYFRYYFFERANEMTYSVGPKDAKREDTLLSLLSTNGPSVEAYKRRNGKWPSLVLRQAFMTAARAFKAIDAPTQGVIVPYGQEGRDLINDLCASFRAEKSELPFTLIRRAQQFSVNVFPNVFEALRKSGALTEVGPETGIYHLNPSHYSEEFGLSETPVSPLEILCA